jgi:amino acid permease
MFAKITYGAAGSLFVKVVIIINNLGMCCAYFIIFGTTCKTLAAVFVDADSYLVTNYHNYIYILFIFIVMSFLAFKDNLDSLKSASFLGVAGITTFFICMIILFFYKLAKGYLPEFHSGMLWPSGKPLDMIGVLPTVFLAYTFQFNVFPIFFTLKTRTDKEMMKATILAVVFCFVIYSITGIIGFLMYGDNLNDTILQVLTQDVEKYKGKDDFLIVILVIINIAFMCSSTMSIPLMFFSFKNNFINSIIFCKKKFGNTRISGESTPKLLHNVDDDGVLSNNCEIIRKPQITQTTRYIITAVLYLSIGLIAIVIPQLKVVSLIYYKYF